MINRLFYLKAHICFLLCQHKNYVLKKLCVQSLFEECCVLILETLSCLHETLFLINLQRFSASRLFCETELIYGRFLKY